MLTKLLWTIQTHTDRTRKSLEARNAPQKPIVYKRHQDMTKKPPFMKRNKER